MKTGNSHGSPKSDLWPHTGYACFITSVKVASSFKLPLQVAPEGVSSGLALPIYFYINLTSPVVPADDRFDYSFFSSPSI